MRLQIFAVSLLALALAGCQTLGANAPSPTTGATQASLDEKVAAASKELAKQCFLLEVGISVGQSVTTNAKALKALAVAEKARADFCAAPPTDVTTAAVYVGKIVVQVADALKKQPKET